MPFAVNGSTRIHYEIEGNGPETVVLVPGLGVAGAVWAPVARHLADRFTLVIPEPRGSGRSDAPEEPYTPEIVAADIIAVLDDVGVESVHLVGLSMGGCISQDVAIAHPDRVKSLSMLCTWAAGDVWLKRMMEFRRDLIVSEGLLEQFRLSFMVVSSPFAFREIPEQLAAVEAAMISNPPETHAYLNQIDYCIQHDRAADLATLDIPAIVLTGSHDILTPVPLGEELAQALGCEFEEVERGSHCLPFERPELIAARITDLVDRVGRVS